LEKLEGIFKIAIKEAMARALEQASFPHPDERPPKFRDSPQTAALSAPASYELKSSPQKRIQKVSLTIPPIAVDLKANNSKPGLREFYAEKKPTNHYEKTAVFAYYLTKFNKETEIKFGEILSCYEEISEKK